MPAKSSRPANGRNSDGFRCSDKCSGGRHYAFIWHYTLEGGNISSWDATALTSKYRTFFRPKVLAVVRSNQASDVTTARPRRRSIFPKDLAKAIRYLDDQEFDRLLHVTTEEARRCGKLPASVELSLMKTGAGSDAPMKKRPVIDRPTQIAAVPSSLSGHSVRLQMRPPIDKASAPRTHQGQRSCETAPKGGANDQRSSQKFSQVGSDPH